MGVIFFEFVTEPPNINVTSHGYFSLPYAWVPHKALSDPCESFPTLDILLDSCDSHWRILSENISKKLTGRLLQTAGPFAARRNSSPTDSAHI